MSAFDPYLSTAQAITLLLHPYAEVVLHDIKTGRIAAIFNSFSKRKVGDESLIEEISDENYLQDVFPIYTKTNWDGRTLKSSTAILRDKNKKAIGLMCINLDISKWEEFRHLLEKWTNSSQINHQPQMLFKDDWREKINCYVSDYLRNEGISLKLLSKEKKQALVKALFREGAFQAKNSASYIADVLDLSRATVYNYLRSDDETSD